jgi:hypothetical protein
MRHVILQLSGGVLFGNELNAITRGPKILNTMLPQLAKQAVKEPNLAQSNLHDHLKMCEDLTITAINRVPNPHLTFFCQKPCPKLS